METQDLLKKEEIKVEEKRVNYTFPPWSYRLRVAMFILSGGVGMFGITKMPTINESSKIAEATETVRNLSDAQLVAVQGVQIIELQKQMTGMEGRLISAITEHNRQFSSVIKDNDARYSARFDKQSSLIVDTIKEVATLKGLILKSTTNN